MEGWWTEFLGWLRAIDLGAALRWVEQAVPWWLRDAHTLAPAAVLTLAVLLHLALLHALLVRLSSRRMEAARKALNAQWNRLVPAYLVGLGTATDIARTLKRGGRMRFADYLRPYLTDFAGSDHDKLLELMQLLGYPGFLARRLRSRSSWKRALAAHLLSLMRDTNSIPTIRGLLADRSERVRFEAAQALLRMNDSHSLPQVLLMMERAYRTRQDLVTELILGVHPEILPLLQAMVRQGFTPPWLTVIIINVLGHLAFLEATWDVLELATQTEDYEVRLACCRALVEFEDPTLAGYFEELTVSPDPVLVAIGARGLARVGEEDHIPVLITLLAHEDFWVLHHTISALMGLGEKGAEALRLASEHHMVSTPGQLVLAEMTHQTQTGETHR